MAEAQGGGYPPPRSWLSEHPPTILRFRPELTADPTAVDGAEQGVLRLEYFAYRALSEHIQLLLELVSVPYDLVMHYNPQFQGQPRYRDYAPHGQLPMLTDPALGFPLSESGAIFRHLARKLGVQGRTPAEVARVDMLCELAQDIKGSDWTGEDRHMKAAESAVAAAGAAGSAADAASLPCCLVGGEPSAADVWLFWVLNYLADTEPERLEPYPALRRFHTAFAEQPAVAAFYQSPRSFPLCKFQQDPKGVSGEYQEQNYLV